MNCFNQIAYFKYCQLLLLALFTMLHINSFAQNRAKDSKPNIVLIVIDDIGYGDLGIYGNKFHKTPNIDKLGSEGMLFSDFHSNGPVCSPTRASIMTGQYQQRSNIGHAIGFTMEEGMPLIKKTIAEILSENGYATAVFGKWHLGHVSLFGPNDQGFDQSWVSNNTPDYHTHISRTGELDWYKNHVLNQEKGYLTDLITSHSIEFITANSQQPFFMFISHIAAHFPFQGPKDPGYRTKGKEWHDTKYGPLPENQYRRAYKDMIETVDKSIGEVVRTLDEQGFRDNTLIFITSDNGAYSWVGSNYPFRGEKGDLLEGGHRIPGIANWPGHITPGSISNEPIMTMDLAPTFLAIAGIDYPTDKEDNFDGIDFGKVLFENKALKKRTLYWHFKNPYTKSYSYAIREGHWKFLWSQGQSHLFNLHLDRKESTDLISNYPKKAEQLKKSYQKWVKEIEKNNIN